MDQLEVDRAINYLRRDSQRSKADSGVESLPLSRVTSLTTPGAQGHTQTTFGLSAELMSVIEHTEYTWV